MLTVYKTRVQAILPPALFNWSCQFESAFWSRLAALCLEKCTVWVGNCGGGGASRGRWGNQATTVIVKSPPRWGESGAFILNSTVFIAVLQYSFRRRNTRNLTFVMNKISLNFPFQQPHWHCSCGLSCRTIFYKSDMSAPVCSVLSLGWVTVTLLPSYILQTPNSTLCTCSKLTEMPIEPEAPGIWRI